MIIKFKENEGFDDGIDGMYAKYIPSKDEYIWYKITGRDEDALWSSIGDIEWHSEGSWADAVDIRDVIHFCYTEGIGISEAIGKITAMAEELKEDVVDPENGRYFLRGYFTGYDDESALLLSAAIHKLIYGEIRL